MKPLLPDSTEKMQTLSQCMNHAIRQGYTENFKVTKHGLSTADGATTFPATKIIIKNFYRFEGYSDPADNSVLYLIETDTHKKGILLDAYDAYADANIAEFIVRVEEIAKQPHKPKSIFRSIKRLLRLE